MEELLENVYIVIPIALLVFARLFAERLKAKRAGEAGATRAADGTRAPGALARFLGRLSGRGPEPTPPRLTVSEPLHFEEPVFRLGERLPPPAAAPVEPRTLVAPAPAPERPVRARPAGSRLPASVERLSPLRKAVVMAEL
ncbi:MAG TPA: hypothetical protein PLH55_10120, partial [Spirochaetales bacterium]|nr:hypothetical protein [Spirochaetales bacterium]